MNQLIDQLNKMDGFANYIGIELLEAENGEAFAKIDLKKHHSNPIGSVHGGCLFTLADTVSGVAVASTGVGCTTLSVHTVYLKAAMMNKSNVIYAKAIPERIGKKIAIYDVVITDDHEQKIAKFTVEYFIMSEVPSTMEFVKK